MDFDSAQRNATGVKLPALMRKQSAVVLFEIVTARSSIYEILRFPVACCCLESIPPYAWAQEMPRIQNTRPSPVARTRHRCQNLIQSKSRTSRLNLPGEQEGVVFDVQTKRNSLLGQIQNENVN